jgi:hypothetical protein
MDTLIANLLPVGFNLMGYEAGNRARTWEAAVSRHIGTVPGGLCAGCMLRLGACECGVGSGAVYDKYTLTVQVTRKGRVIVSWKAV